MQQADLANGNRAVSAAVIGNVLEWYDFAVYAFVAGIIAKKFFPQTDEVTALLSAFLAYGLGFVARPLGGIVIGRLGDTQGFSAGGEWGGSTTFIVEWAPKGRRGWYGSFQQTSVVAGLLLGSGVAALFNTVLTQGQMSDWGWRVPFLLGGILGPVGLYMRRTITETPAYKSAVRATSDTTRERGLGLSARAFGFTIVWTVCFYVLLNYMPTYTQKYLQLSPSAALWANTIGLCVLLVCIPFMGRLSDRLGRKPLLIACCVAFVILPYPVFNYLLSGIGYGELVAVQILFAVLISMFSGPGPAAIAEIFPTRSRSTWMTSGYALAVALFGGFAPFISVWLIDRFQSPTAHVWYLVAAAVVSLLVILSLRETAHEDLR